MTKIGVGLIKKFARTIEDWMTTHHKNTTILKVHKQNEGRIFKFQQLFIHFHVTLHYKTKSSRLFLRAKCEMTSSGFNGMFL